MPRAPEKEWSRLVKRYEAELSPLMAGYRELLRPGEEVVPTARPEESYLLEEYRALVEGAARESDEKGNPGNPSPRRMRRSRRSKRPR
jgi:hypothetical protein